MTKKFSIIFLVVTLGVCMATLFLSSPALAFSMNSGYYVGNGRPRSITGVGFQPDLVIIKCDRSTGRPVWRSSAMTGDSSTYFEYANINQGDLITSLDSDGFSLGTNNYVNYTNVRYTWVAFSGSGDGTFKVGSYTGDSLDNRNITGLGFQPDLVWVKGDSLNYAIWSSSAMAADSSEYFRASAPIANCIQSLLADGFQVGTSSNVNGVGTTYYYVAFKVGASSCSVGTYTGNGVDNRSISGLGFNPDLVLVKQSSAANYAVMRNDQNYGDDTHMVYPANNATNHIQAFEADGFQIGTNDRVNANASTYYYMAFAGVPATTLTGNFTFKTGNYTGNGTSQTISGVGFRPDLIIITADNAYDSVYTTSMMPDSYTYYLGRASGAFLTGITLLSDDGFSVGGHSRVNYNNIVYRWYAFGNAPCANFIVGAYTGNGEDDRDITGLGLDPSLVTVKSYSSYNGLWKTSSMAGDITAYLWNTADAANLIQDLGTDSFEIGTDLSVNRSLYLHYYFAFKDTANYFTVSSYTGNGADDRSIAGLGAKPNWLWIKASNAGNPAHRGLTITGDETQFFNYLANSSNRIQELNSTGFQIGSDNDVNQNAVNYWYAAWLGIPAKLGFVVQPTETTAGSNISPDVVVAVQDQFGHTIDYDNSTSITLSLFSNPGSATLSGTLTRQVSGGVATFEGLSLNKTGTGYVIQAAATGYTSANSAAFNVIPAAGNYLSFLSQPTTTEVNRIISPSIEVAVKDTLGNIDTSDNTTLISIAFQNNPSSATLSGTLTKTASSGVVCFDDLSVNWRGNGYTLIATAPYITQATSEGFDITAEAVVPTITSYSPTNEASGVSLESKAIINFSEDMDQSSVQNAFTCRAIRNNLGVSIDTAVAGSFSWPLGSSMQFTPSETWEYNYVYQADLSREARDLVGNAIGSSLVFHFTTISTSSSVNTTVGDDGRTEISFPAGAIDVPFYVRINTSPEADPIEVDPAAISAANVKVENEGNQFKSVIDGTFREFLVFDNSGEYISGPFNSAATIVLPYVDSNNDGYVDGLTPPVRVEDLRICRLDEDNCLWIIYPDSTVDTSDRSVSAGVNSLSTFALMAQASTSVADVYSFPNPFRPAAGHTTITFANLPATCTIKVFTLTGQLVRTILENDGDRQSTWDVTNETGESLVSGLYLYVVKSDGNTRVGKLVIIK